MRKITVILLLMPVLFQFLALAEETGNTTTLENRLKAAQDKDKLPILVQLTDFHLKKNPQKALEYGKESLALLERFADNNTRLTVLDQLCQIYKNMGEYSQAKEYGEKCLELARKIGSRRGEGVALNIIAIIYHQEGEYTKARENSIQALEIFRELDDKKLMAGALNNIGINFDMQGNYEKALEYYLKSLKIKEELGDKQLIASSLNNIGVIYNLLDNLQEALDYFSRALKLREELGDQRGIASLYINIGNIYEKMKDYPKTMEYYQKSLAIDQGLNNQSGVASTLFNIGLLHRESGDNQQSLDYLQQSLSIREQMGEKGSMAGTLIEIGKVYLQMGRSRQAIRTIEQGLALAREIGVMEPLKEGILALSTGYEALNDYQQALKFYKEYKTTADQIINSESRKKIAEIQARYDADKKEKEILLLKKNSEIQQLTLNRQRILRNVMIAALIAIFLAGGLLLRKYRYIITFWKKKNYIGHYRIIEQMGSGGMGTIYRAADVVDTSHKKTIAVKVLREEYFANEIQKKRFKQEASIIDQVVHPNIVRVIERGESDGGLYIAMEVLEGPTLAELLEEKKKLDIPLAIHIMVQMADALKSIHAMNIIHRDLKPENIKLVEKDGDPYFVKLMDFGLAITQYMSRFTETGIVLGTLYYLSPEQVCGGSITTASDVHALGAIFYEMLTGHKPYGGDTTIDVMKQIIVKEPVEIPKLRPDLDRSLADLIMFMLKKDPALRPTSETIFTILKHLQEYTRT